MTQLNKGGNIELPATAVQATLHWTSGPGVPDLNVSALLLDGSGVVGSEADFVFYNQPEHPSGAVRLSGRTPGAEGADRVDVDLFLVPAVTERIVLVASATGGTLGQVRDLVLEITDTAAAKALASFPMQADTETAFLCGEVYRRGGAWKFRAVGQGYASGLAGLARDFGIDVGRPEPAAPPPTPPGPEAPAGPPAPPTPAVPPGRAPLDLDTPWPPS